MKMKLSKRLSLLKADQEEHTANFKVLKSQYVRDGRGFRLLIFLGLFSGFYVQRQSRRGLILISRPARLIYSFGISKVMNSFNSA
jgi:hypothetical protein